MAKKQRGNKKDYEAAQMPFMTILGMMIIALGILSLIAVVGGIEGAFFGSIKQMMHGLGGTLCIGVSILLVWGGLVVAFSASGSVPVRGFLLFTLMFLSILAMLNLLSKVGDSGFFVDYCVQHNRTNAVPNPDSYGKVIAAAYDLCSRQGVLGGALGMLLGWPAQHFLGPVMGTILLVVITIACVLLFTRFDFLQTFQNIRESLKARQEEKAQVRAQQQYQQQIWEQQQQELENQNNLNRPAFVRNGRKQAQPEMQQGQGMGDGQAYAAQAAAMGMQPMYAAMQAPKPEAQLYDEMIIPQGQLPTWATRKVNKQGTQSKTQQAYQTRMTFTPREMGVVEDSSDDAMMNKKVSNTTPLSSEKRKATARLEAIRQRKAELNLEVANSMQARGETADPQPDAPAEATFETFQPLVDDSDAAYRRPAPLPEESPAKEATVYQMPDVPQEPQYHASDFAPLITSEEEDEEEEKLPYAYPSVDLLNMQKHQVADTRQQDAENARKLEKTLASFNIPAKVQSVTHGPAITRFAMGLTSSGINVKRILNISDNIALDLAANGGVRIESQIPGTNLFGVEVPNKEVQSVTFAEVLMSPEMQNATSTLAVGLGHDISGKPIICDLAKMPHLLIAGQTGSGKSVCINTIINSLLFRSSPEEVRMIMIDPKVVELQCYNVVPHLLIPVVSDPHKAAGALAWAVAEMQDRYQKMQRKNVRELTAYNAKLMPGEPKLPRIVIIIDELADLMLACKKDVEESITRLAQLARAAGIHMIVATQRPTVDVITGLIKANIPSRIAFAVSSSIDSRTIIDRNGAEKLLGRGDMLYFPTGASAPARVQGCFLSDAEIERVVNYIGQHTKADFDPDIIEALERQDDNANVLDDGGEDGGLDERLAEAIEMVVNDGQASISMLQRRMKIGYARAGRLIDDMAARGIVSKSTGTKAREVLMTREEYERIKGSLLG